MHGRVKKDVVVPSAEEKAKQREQVRTARGLFGKLLELRGSKVYNEQALEMTSKALQFHPEFPTLWGYRRELLTNMEMPLKEVLKGEMKLLEKALRKSQKVYSIWFHRKWVVERLFEEAAESTIRQLLDNELELCNQLLAVDERNFHCWNHRMFLMDLMRSWLKGKEDQVDLNAIDLKLSTDLINNNFSNYSAWHLRTLLQQVLGTEGPRVKLDLDQELEWVQQGIYTEPNDQSVWLYHQWLTLRDAYEPRISHCAKMAGELFIFFSQPVSASTVQLGGHEVPLEALASGGTRTRRAARRWGLAWRASVTVGPEVELTVGRYAFRGRLRDVDQATEGDQQGAVAVAPAVASELQRVEELLEIEPECRWALLAHGRLKQRLGGRPDEELRRLGTLDPLRRQFYLDALKELELESRLQAWRLSEPLELQQMALRQLKPTTVASIFGVTVLKLDENELSDLGPLLLLLSLKELSVAKNRLQGQVAEVFQLFRLRKADVSCNCLKLGYGSPPKELMEIDMTQNHFEASKAFHLLPKATWSLQLDGRCVARRAS